MVVDMATMMYNPNNVATEASPLTTEKEREVGRELCYMLGYGYDDDVTPWGHITCVSDLLVILDCALTNCILILLP